MGWRERKSHARQTAFATLSATLLVIALASGCGGGSGSGSPGDGPEQGDDQQAPPPAVEDVWTGIYELEDYQGRVMLDLAQEPDGSVTGDFSASAGEQSAALWPEMEGEARPGDELQLTYKDENEEWELNGTLQGTDSMKGTLEGTFEDNESSYDLELQRVDTSSPENMALVAVQAVHDRNFTWITENAHTDWRDGDYVSSTEEHAEDIEETFEDEIVGYDYEAPPPANVGVSLVEDTVTTQEASPDVGVEFDYETSDGETGHAFVMMTEAGTEESGYSLQLASIDLEYEAEGESMSITLGAGNY